MIKKPLCSYNGEIKELQAADNIVGLENVTNDAQLKRAAGDINTLDEKITLADDDIILIEDSADSYNKKKVKKSAIGNSIDIQVAYKTLTETIISSTLYQNDDALFAELKANGIYQYELVLRVSQQGGTSAGFKARFTAPAGATAYSHVLKNSTSNNSFITANISNSFILNQEGGTISGSGDFNFLKACGLIINGSEGGTLNLQWAQNVSNSINTSVMVGSYLKLIKAN